MNQGHAMLSSNLDGYVSLGMLLEQNERQQQTCGLHGLEGCHLRE